MKKIIPLLFVFLFSFYAKGQYYNKLIGIEFSGSSGGKLGTIETLDGGNLSYGKLMSPGYYLIKTNAVGDTTWCRTLTNIGGGDIDVIQIPDSSYWVTMANTSAASQPIDVLRLNKNGNTIIQSNEFDFSSISNGIGYSGVRSVLNNNGDIMTFAHHNNGENVVIFLWDTLGNIINQQTILTSFPNTPAPSYLSLRNLVVKSLSNGNIVIGGVSSSDVNNYIYVIEFDVTNNIVWKKLIQNNTGLLSNFNLNAIDEMPDGSVLISGGCGNSSYASGTALLKFDALGNLLFAKAFDDNARMSKVISDNSGMIYLASGGANNTQDNLFRIALYKLSPSANLMSSRMYGLGKNSEYQIEISNIFTKNNEVKIFAVIDNLKLNVFSTNNNFDGAPCEDSPSSVNITDVAISFTPWTFSSNALNAFSTAPFPTLSTGMFNLSSMGLNTSGIVDNPLCNGDLGQVNYTVSGGTTPYGYSWSNGTNSQNLVNAQSGQYTVRTVDAAGCVELDTFSIVEPLPLSATFNKTDVTCFSAFDGSINLTVGGGTPGFSYFWANGAHTQDISGLGGGFYQVTITDTNGCTLTQGISVAEPGPLTANVIGYQDVSCHGLCDGQLTGNAAGGTSPYQYAWNDTYNQTTAIADSLCTGNYLLTVTDNNGCMAYTNAFVSQPPIIQNSINTSNATCGNNDGGAMINTTGGVPPYSYIWSNGSTSNPNTNLAAGTYYVTGTDANGCGDTAVVTIDTDVFGASICEITVDSTSTKNLVVWEKPVAGNIAGFNIYRDVVGLYQLIDFVPYDSLSVYLDESNGIDPTTTSYRYKISAVDTCGNEGSRSAFHETIHLTTNQGINNEVNLIWDGYKGFQLAYYRIIADTSNNNMEDFYVIDSVAYTNFTWTDNSPPTSNYLVYAIEVVTPYTCTATKAQSHNTTRSNRATLAGGSTGTSIEEAILQQAEVYPNPFNNQLTVNVRTNNWNYKIIDMTGKMILSGNSQQSQEKLDLYSLDNGVYFIQIAIGGNTITKKIIKS